jgi:hypothetical protein
MSSDPGNMPFQRLMPDHPVSVAAAQAPGIPQALHADSILLQEFNHANVTAYQAKEERARLFSTYLVQMGVVVSAVVTLETIYASHPQIVLTVGAIIMGAFGGIESVVYFARVFALGSTLQDSIVAMNLIKEFYIQQLQREMPQLEHAFHWRLAGKSARKQSGKMPFLMSSSLSLIGSAFFAFAVALLLFLQQMLTLPEDTAVQTTPADIAIVSLALLVCLLAFAAQYAVLVRRHNAEGTLLVEADKLGLVLSRPRGRRE